jgi:predicted acetyltransferase
MSVIRLLEGEDFEDYINQSLDAYPIMVGTVTPESRSTWKENMKKAQSEAGPYHYYGCYRDGKMVGGARYHDFEMNLHGKIVKVGGIGNVYVNLLNKKEHVAKELVQHFHEYYRDQGAVLSTLYPFRPDFYNKMGYGYGRKLNQYRFKPSDLPKGKKDNIVFLNKDDLKQVYECYTTYVKNTHGMIVKNEAGIERLLKGNKVVGYKKNECVEGFACMKFEKMADKNPLLQNIVAGYFIYNSVEALHGILAFFNSQLDQVDRIVCETQDDDFHFLAKDPRDGDPDMYYTSQETNRQALGIMYRVINTTQLFKEMSKFNFNNVTLKLKLTIEDSFLPENSGSTILHFSKGKLKVGANNNYEVEVKMSVEWFSSLIMGVINFKKLVTYRLAEVSDSNYVDKIHELFYFKEKPITLESF